MEVMLTCCRVSISKSYPILHISVTGTIPHVATSLGAVNLILVRPPCPISAQATLNALRARSLQDHGRRRSTLQPSELSGARKWNLYMNTCLTRRVCPTVHTVLSQSQQTTVIHAGKDKHLFVASFVVCINLSLLILLSSLGQRRPHPS